MCNSLHSADVGAGEALEAGGWRERKGGSSGGAREMIHGDEDPGSIGTVQRPCAGHRRSVREVRVLREKGRRGEAALTLALADSGLSRVALAQRLGVDEKAVRRMLDPRHRTAIARIETALRVLGHDLVVETRAA